MSAKSEISSGAVVLLVACGRSGLCLQLHKPYIVLQI